MSSGTGRDERIFMSQGSQTLNRAEKVKLLALLLAVVTFAAPPAQVALAQQTAPAQSKPAPAADEQKAAAVAQAAAALVTEFEVNGLKVLV